jgi:ribokinase
MQRPSRILVIGSSNTDLVAWTERFPLPGETILGNRFLMNQGGKGANQAVAAARLGGQVALLCKVGQDLFGQEAIRILSAEGIDVSSVVVDPDHTSGVALITVNDAAENSIVVAPGANMALTEADVASAATQVELSDVVLMQLEIPLSTVFHAAELAHSIGKRVILNPAPVTTLPDELFSCLYAITPNETEVEQLTGIGVSDERTAREAAASLKNKGVEIVLITLGPRGAYVFSDELKRLIPAPKVHAIDTTAAGDTFNGALAVALTRSLGLGDAVAFANSAASISVTRRGAQSSMPFAEEITAQAFHINELRQL